MPLPLDRDDIIEILAQYTDRGSDDVSEDIGSLERVWLANEVEQRYGIVLDVGEEQMSQMTTVDDAAVLLSRLVPDADDG